MRNYQKLVTEKRNQLYVKSMGKLHQVTHFAFDEESWWYLLEKHDLLTLSLLPGFENVQMMSGAYRGGDKSVLEDKSNGLAPYASMYIRVCDGNYYQLVGVFSDVELANEFMLKRDKTTLIDSTQFNKEFDTFHFVACIEKAF